ncbi:unnamed protein product [Eruca vesicaria subsp. sativa]|uniref:Transmembrane protein n=1 Tax=Eruca vesicaria subsp. sativa TaxID=29727 RepID=A0ABC8LVE9_ERUVS|nr:unnamed protein product [Eruca vesicaria subsp. sativa]
MFIEFKKERKRKEKNKSNVALFFNNLIHQNPNLSSQSQFVTIFTIRRLNPNPIVPFFVNRRHGLLPPQIREVSDRRPQLSFPFLSENVKDRTRDILSVVMALLFGVGCGALTAATMYLVWALVVNRRGYGFDEEEEDDYENEESDEASLKKFGYVKIPDPVVKGAA